MLEYEYATAISTVLCDEALTDKIRELRINGVQRLKRVAERYAKEGFIERLISDIWNHKLPLIMDATSKTVMDEIVRPSVPRYSGGRFLPNPPYHSEVEELLIWSIISPNCRFIPEGNDRFTALFNKHFPDMNVG